MAEQPKGPQPLIGRDDLTDADMIEALKWIEEAARRASGYIESAPEGHWGTRRREARFASTLFHVARSVHRTALNRRNEARREFENSPEMRLLNAIFNNNEEN